MSAFGENDPEKQAGGLPSHVHIGKFLTYRHSHVHVPASARSSAGYPRKATMASSADITHLSQSLQRLHVQQHQHQPDASPDHLSRDLPDDPRPIPRTPISRDGYGFRRSGVTTPAHPTDLPAIPPKDLDLILDHNGLGWPGMSLAPPLPIAIFSSPQPNRPSADSLHLQRNVSSENRG